MKDLKVKLLTISLLSSFTYAETNDFVIIVNKNNSEYEMDIHFVDKTEVTPWVVVSEDCTSDIVKEDLYYGKTGTQNTTCDKTEERTTTVTREYSTGRTEIIKEETESKTTTEIKAPVTITGSHLEASCKDALAFDSTLITQRYTIKVPNEGNVRVTCDMDTNGGGWTVFQYRTSFYDFYHNWQSYEDGFGTSSNFWLGNKYLHELTKNGTELYVDLRHGDGTTKYARYSNFSIGDATSKYTITVGGYSGNAGDSLTGHSGHKFSTKDRDNDTHSSENCATRFKGAWWYSACHSSNLNGYYHNGSHSSYADGVNWYHWTGHYYSLPRTKMMVR